MLTLLLAGEACLLSGCGKSADKYERTTFIFGKDQSVEVIYVEDFDRDYYDAQELEEQVDAQISSFNSLFTKVDRKSLSVEDGKARLDLSFTDSDAYEDFNDVPLYYGTLAGAGQKGYDTASFIGLSSTAKKGEPLSASEATDMDDVPVIIVCEPGDLITTANIAYVSDNVSVDGKKRASVSDTVSEEAPALIILED